MRYSKVIQLSGLSLAALLLCGYGVYQARMMLSGPQITLKTPKTGSSFSDPLITIAGAAHNISAISLNDRPIFIDEHGNFSEKLLLSPGYTIMKVQASDKFGRETQQLLELTYTPTISQPSSLSQSATSTSSSIVRN